MKTKDDIGQCPRGEALRELATLAEGAVLGNCADLTVNGAKIMRTFADALWRRYARHTNKCVQCGKKE